MRKTRVRPFLILECLARSAKYAALLMRERCALETRGMINQSADTRTPIFAFIASATLAVVVLDALGAFVSVQTGVPYEWFFAGSVLIYGLTGASTYRFAGRAIGSDALAALAVGIADATLG